MKHGQHEEEIIRQCVQHKMPLPESIANAPTLELGLELYFHAFLDLQSCRQIGMAEGTIPWTAIKEWGVFNRLDDEQMEDLFFLVRQMDHCWLEYQSKEMERKNG